MKVRIILCMDCTPLSCATTATTWGAQCWVTEALRRMLAWQGCHWQLQHQNYSPSTDFFAKKSSYLLRLLVKDFKCNTTFWLDLLVTRVHSGVGGRSASLMFTQFKEDSKHKVVKSWTASLWLRGSKLTSTQCQLHGTSDAFECRGQMRWLQAPTLCTNADE